MNYAIIILVNATSQWLSLSRTERDTFVDKELNGIFKKFKRTCNVKLFDSDFTNASVSDFMIVETDSLEQFGYLMGYLRESKTFAKPYFEVKDLIIGVPNKFRGSMDIQDVSA
ncbi:darcynin family protein [Chryseobacterium sp. SIMBA_029]|uniref:darcynin family protein n=1 Tax=Chryseobacterium sp. SIMBA_029 TaxID=3085772 RepID=UPI00397B9380